MPDSHELACQVAPEAEGGHVQFCVETFSGHAVTASCDLHGETLLAKNAAVFIYLTSQIANKDDRSLGDVLGLSAGTPVGSLASLVVGVLSLNTGNVLVFLHGSSSDLLSGALHFVDLGGLVSNLTISGH